MNLVQQIIVAIGLSMDAFSLSLVYGTLNLEKRMINFLSITVGCFHFFMPILGSIIGKYIILSFLNNSDLIVGIIFVGLGIEMLISIKELDTTTAIITSFSQALLFAFSVSIDSFSVGIGLGAHKENMFICGLIFALFSFLFTKLGLALGKKLTLKFGKMANVIGSIILLVLGIGHLV